MNFRSVYPFTPQVLVGVLGRGKKQVRELIGNYAVNFLGHAAVARAQPSFYVSHSHLKFGAHQCCGHSGVDITVDEDKVRTAFGYNRLEATHDLGRLTSMAA